VIAFVAQYGFDLWPCLLCYEQRIPYLIAFVVACFALVPGVDPAARRHIVFLCVLLFAGNAGLAAFHAGVEYKWWPGLDACGGALRDITVEDLAAALSKPAAQPGCDEAAIRVFGISMAGGNVIVCEAMAAFCLWAALQKPRWATP
jgi:disulfide bond formation protein DsbB